MNNGVWEFLLLENFICFDVLWCTNMYLHKFTCTQQKSSSGVTENIGPCWKLTQVSFLKIEFHPIKMLQIKYIRNKNMSWILLHLAMVDFQDQIFTWWFFLSNISDLKIITTEGKIPLAHLVFLWQMGVSKTRRNGNRQTGSCYF